MQTKDMQSEVREKIKTKKLEITEALTGLVKNLVDLHRMEIGNNSDSNEGGIIIPIDTIYEDINHSIKAILDCNKFTFLAGHSEGGPEN
jgi:hypothetical protein